MEHLSSIHGEKIQCDLCDFQAYPYERVAKHQIIKHNICQVCGERFECSKDLEQHTEVVHRKKIDLGGGSNAPIQEKSPPKISKGAGNSFLCDLCDYQGELGQKLGQNW